MRAFIRQRFDRWLDLRLPPQERVRLDRGKVFIFPSRAGFAFLFLLLLLWLMATNYENNLVFLFTFLLTGFFLVAMLQSFANLGGLEVRFSGYEPAFAGELVAIDIILSQQGDRYRDGLIVSFADSDRQELSLTGKEMSVTLPVKTVRRGWLNPRRLTLESQFPMGLFRVWTHLDLNCRALIYPKPIASEPAKNSTRATGEGPLEGGQGTEDFVGLRNYIAGESRHRIAWKNYAREQGLHTKHFADPMDERIWLDWEQHPGMDREARLSRLCGRLLKVNAAGLAYGLRLPGIEIQPARGENHKQRLLRELALFELSESQLS